MRRKKLCKGCREYFRPKEDEPETIAHCSPDCAVAIVRKKWDKDAKSRERSQIKAKKAEKREHAKQKREFQQNDLKVRKPAAKNACHAYIRERDKNEPCICCNRPLGENYHAGHWLESGNNPQTRYDSRNINAQRIDCNFFKGGDSGDYEANLRAKIGDEAVEELKSMKGGTMKRTAQDYLEIEGYYKNKIKELEKP